MPKKPKASKRSKALDPRRPFDPAILSEAKRIVDDYEIVIWFEDGEWYGHGLEFSTAYGYGATVDECVSSTQEGLIAGVASMMEDGEQPPRPAKWGELTEQISIMFTAKERALLDNRSRAGGFQGISEYVRAVALAESPVKTATVARPRRRARK
jgi:predicted RNase H-like HicB family nuclease